jgi:DNA-binding SARP family transcriptional activator/SAM-dependent methyltransferase
VGGRVEVTLLGPVEARLEGDPVGLGAPQRVLLARLALARGRVVADDTLVEALWAEPPDNAAGNLHSYVSRLRRAIGGDRVPRAGGGYRLDLDAAAIDVERVDILTAAARRAAANGDQARAAALFGEALDQWRGDPLADLPDPLPFAPDIAHLLELRAVLEEEWFECRVGAGAPDPVLPDLERAARRLPSRERLHLLWMRALHLAGRTPEALRVGDAFRRRLVDQTGVDPSPALAELERVLLAGELSVPSPSAPQTRTPRGRRSPADLFVGRGDDLAATEAALAAHRLVTIVGSDGVGKTRLVLELLDRRGGLEAVHLVELGEVSSASDVTGAVAAVLGLLRAGGRTADLADRLGGEPVLLVLDTCEHVLAAVAELVRVLLLRCPALRVLATSRRRLGVAGERVVPLAPLPEPAVIELFCDRAARLRAAFDPATADPAAVADIGRLVDGLPLGVELAAGREAVFGLAQLRERLALGLEVLEPVGDAGRGQALTATVEWSYRLRWSVPTSTASAASGRRSRSHCLPSCSTGRAVAGPPPAGPTPWRRRWPPSIATAEIRRSDGPSQPPARRRQRRARIVPVMTTLQESPNLDDAAEAFVDRFLTDLAGAATTVMTVVGDRLGLYTAMNGAGPLTPGDLAAATGLHERLVREWLASQTVSEYVRYDPVAGTFELPAAHAAVLAHADSPVHLVSAAEIIAGQFLTLDRLEQAFRADGGIDYDTLPHSLFHAVERYFRTAYRHELAQTWLPAVHGLVSRLEAGARVADVGCGHGFATLLMARTWPASTFVGFDVHEPSIATARARALEAGDPPNVTFRVADAAAIRSRPFDVIVFLDALHDLGDPPAALRQAHELLVDGGIVVAVEPWSLDRLEDGIGNPGVRIDYSCSTSVCTPCSLAQPGGYGLGTQGGPSRRLRLLADAGFRNPVLAADSGFNLVLAATR